jgi:hypothetical protein
LAHRFLRAGTPSTPSTGVAGIPEVLNSYMDGKLVLELKAKAESELRGDVQSLKAKKLPSSPYCAAGLRKKPNARQRRSSELRPHRAKLKPPPSFAARKPVGIRASTAAIETNPAENGGRPI